MMAYGQDPNPIKLELPKGIKTDSKKSLVVSINSKNEIFIDSQLINPAYLDSILSVEIDKLSPAPIDHSLSIDVTVVIVADPMALYGTVFNIMRSSKKKGAKVIARVDD